MARDVQGYVLPIIPKVILGIESSDTATDPISQSNIGSAMAWYSFLPFFDYANETCDTGTIQKIAFLFLTTIFRFCAEETDIRCFW